jgi:hypothetical protein
VSRDDVVNETPRRKREEMKLQANIMAAIGALPHVVVHRNNVGTATFPTSDGRLARVEYGVGGKGATDILAEVHTRAGCSPVESEGVWVAVWMEVKTDEGVLSKDQQEWHAAAKRMRRNVCVVRSIAQALAVVDDVVATGRVSS